MNQNLLRWSLKQIIDREFKQCFLLLEFTPLEFETKLVYVKTNGCFELEFTPLEFETWGIYETANPSWQLEFTPLEFETSFCYTNINEFKIRIYSVGV